MTAVTLELPDELVANFDLKQLTNEVTDFLLSKNKPSAKALLDVSTPFTLTDWNDAEFTEMAMNQAMRGMENEPALYESLTDNEQNTQQLLEAIKNIKPVKARYSSEVLLRELRNEKTISPITQSLIGLLANSNLDETDYKKHLEDKYL